MVWKKKKRLSGKNAHYSISKKLRKENKSTEEFELMLNNLSLEDIIALKLELATKPFGGKCYGIPIWHSTREIVQDAMLKMALSTTRSKKEAARFLGLIPQDLRKLIKKYNTESFFEEEVKNT
jgi:hypothetical protein|tara:strand:+ start:4571 stop:4939 length:369 start_codon:yes stop_codon:yes gene_type:complete